MVKQYFYVFLVLLLIVSLTGCSVQEAPAPTQTEAPTTVPTEAPTTIPTTEPTEPPTTEPAPVRHSGLKEDGTFDEGTLFIGDSLTYFFVGYLREQVLAGDAKYTTQCGSQVTAFFDYNRMEENEDAPCRYSPEFKGLEFDDAAASMGETATAIYIMWGTNFTYTASAQNYIDIVDFLLERCPNATIHLQLIPYGTPSYVFHETVNGRIREAYDHYLQQGQDRVILIDTFTAIGDNTIDGVHMNQRGNAAWYQAILDSAEANGLVQ